MTRRIVRWQTVEEFEAIVDNDDLTDALIVDMVNGDDIGLCAGADSVQLYNTNITIIDEEWT